MTIAVLVGLFAIQRFGTHVIGRVFGPVMVVWFAVIAAAGLGRIVAHPAIVKALSPSYGVEFFGDHLGIAFISLGAIVLTITGAEALYADMGHFGRTPISRAWFFVVFPALTLNYMGQGSLILDTPSAIDNPFFLLIPHWGRMPMVVLATVATVIASQAVISGAFSVTRQAVQLGFLPRLTIRHTSAREIGQVYVPAVNWFLLAAVVALVLGFGSSTRLASAYGIAVTGTITVDTLLFLVVVRHALAQTGLAGRARRRRLLHRRPRLPRRQPDQGRARRLVPAARSASPSSPCSAPGSAAARRSAAAGSRRRGRCAPSSRSCARCEPPVVRVPGTAVYLNARRETTPLALRAGVEHNFALHESVVIISIETTKAPYVPESERLVVDNLGYEDDGISHLTARFGFQDTLDVPRLLALAAETRPGVRRRRRGRRLLPLPGLDHPDRRARHARLAQAPLRGDVAQRRQPGRLLPPAPRPHRHDRLADRALVRRRFRAD